MDGINNNAINQIGRIDLNQIKPKEDTTKNAVPQKTGNLSASMEYEGVANRFLVKGKSEETKLKQALHEDLKFLKKHYPEPTSETQLPKDVVINQQLEDFHFLVGKMPLPSSPEELADISLDDYLRHKALDNLERFETFLQVDPRIPGPEDADEVKKLGGEANWIREKAYDDMMYYIHSEFDSAEPVLPPDEQPVNYVEEMNIPTEIPYDDIYSNQKEDF